MAAYYDSSRRGKEIQITQGGDENDDSIVDDDDDEFDVSDNMLNDSILLQRPTQKGHSINYNVFSIADDASSRANGMIEP